MGRGAQRYNPSSEGLDSHKYIEEKEQKLREQRAPSEQESSILRGVVVWFNGLCDGYAPDQILALVKNHGGRVEHHFRVR